MAEGGDGAITGSGGYGELTSQSEVGSDARFEEVDGRVGQDAIVCSGNLQYAQMCSTPG